MYRLQDQRKDWGLLLQPRHGIYLVIPKRIAEELQLINRWMEAGPAMQSES